MKINYRYSWKHSQIIYHKINDKIQRKVNKQNITKYAIHLLNYERNLADRVLIFEMMKKYKNKSINKIILNDIDKYSNHPYYVNELNKILGKKVNNIGLERKINKKKVQILLTEDEINQLLNAANKNKKNKK